MLHSLTSTFHISNAEMTVKVTFQTYTKTLQSDFSTASLSKFPHVNRDNCILVLWLYSIKRL